MSDILACMRGEQSVSKMPKIGGFYAGGGMTVRVLEVFEDDARVEVVLRRGTLYKRRPTGLIPLKEFGSRMHESNDPSLAFARNVNA